MSMNLHCKSGGQGIPLRQTPTQITYMCMVQPNGDIPFELTGKRAKHSLQIYIQWIQGSLNRVYNTIEDSNIAREYVNEEINNLRKILNSRKKLEVYVM